MLEYLPQSTKACLGFKVSDKLTEEDYAAFLPRLNDALAAYGKINMLMVIDHFEGYANMDVAKTDFKFGTHQYHQVEKLAVVGNKKWYKWAVKVLDPFTRHTEEHFFEPEQIDEAWQWAQTVD